MKYVVLYSIFILAAFFSNQTFAQTLSQKPEGFPTESKSKEPKDSIAQKVDEIFAEWDKKDSPGVAVGIIKDGKLIYKRGYGLADLENNIPITSETAFYIGSTSKQFTAMCVALLEEEGKISIEDDIRKYLPELPQYEKTITVRHLIHHLSGIRDYLTLRDLSGRNFADSYPEEEALAMIARQKSLIFTPGEQYSYSNSNYFLLSLIVKRTSGKSLDEFSGERIFKPLGMNNTHFHDDRTKIIKNRATGHVPKPGSGFAIYKSSFDLVGDGGLYTTIEDLFKWDQNFYQNKLGKGGQKLIDRVLTYGKVNDGREIIYAWALQRQRYRGLRIVFHNGGFIGFRSELLRFPEQNFSVIVLGNASNISAPALATKVADIYLAELLQERPKPTPQQPSQNNRKDEAGPAKMSDEELREYAGNFYSDELDVSYLLKVNNGQFQLKIGYLPDIPLIFTGQNKFTTDGRVLIFNRDPQNKITGFSLSTNSIKDIKFVKKL